MKKKVHEHIKADLAVSGALALELRKKIKVILPKDRKTFLQQVIHKPFEKKISGDEQKQQQSLF